MKTKIEIHRVGHGEKERKMQVLRHRETEGSYRDKAGDNDKHVPRCQILQTAIVIPDHVVA